MLSGHHHPQSTQKNGSRKFSQSTMNHSNYLDNNITFLKSRMNDIKDADLKLKAGIEQTRQKVMRNLQPEMHPLITNSIIVDNMRQNFTRQNPQDLAKMKTTHNNNRLVFFTDNNKTSFQFPVSHRDPHHRLTLSECGSPSYNLNTRGNENVQNGLQIEIGQKNKRIEWLEYELKQTKNKLIENSKKTMIECQQCFHSKQIIFSLEQQINKLKAKNYEDQNRFTLESKFLCNERDNYKFRLAEYLKQKTEEINSLHLTIEKYQKGHLKTTTFNDSTRGSINQQVQIDELKLKNSFLNQKLKDAGQQLLHLQKSIHRSTQGSLDVARNSNPSDYDYLMNKHQMLQTKLIEVSNVNSQLRNQSQNNKKIIENYKDDNLRQKLLNQKIQADFVQINKQRKKQNETIVEMKNKNIQLLSQYHEIFEKYEKLQEKTKKVFEKTEVSSQVSGKPSFKLSEDRQNFEKKQKDLLIKIKEIESEIQYVYKQKQAQICERKVYESKVKQLYQKMAQINDQNYRLKSLIKQDQSQKSEVVFTNKNKIESLFSPERNVVNSVMNSMIENQNDDRNQDRVMESIIKESRIKQSYERSSLEQLKLKRQALMKKIQSIAVQSSQSPKQQSQKNLIRINSKLNNPQTKNSPGITSPRSRNKAFRNSESNFQINFHEQPQITQPNSKSRQARDKIFKQLWIEMQQICIKMQNMSNELSQQKHKLYEQIELLEQQRNQIFCNLCSAQDYIDRLSEQANQTVNQLKQKNQIIDKIKLQFSKTKESLQEKEISIGQQKRQNQQLAYECNKLSSTNQILNQNVLQLTLSQTEIKQQNQLLNQSVTNLTNANRMLTQNNSSISQKLLLNQRQIQALTSQAHELKQKNMTLTSIQTPTSTAQNPSTLMNQSFEQISHINHQIDEIFNKIMGEEQPVLKSQRLALISQHITKLDIQNQRLERQMKQVFQNLFKAENYIEQVEHRLDEIIKQKQKHEENLRRDIKLGAQISLWKQRNRALEQDIKLLHENWQKQQMVIRKISNLTSNTSDNTSNNNNSSHLIEQISRMVIENQNLNAKLSKLQVENQNIVFKLNQEQQNNHTQISKLLSNINLIEQQCNHLKSIIEQKQSQTHQKILQKKQVQIIISKNQAIIFSLQHSLRQNIEKLQFTEKCLMQTTAKFQYINGLHEQTSVKITQLETKIQISKALIQTMQKQKQNFFELTKQKNKEVQQLKLEVNNSRIQHLKQQQNREKLQLVLSKRQAISEIQTTEVHQLNLKNLNLETRITYLQQNLQSLSSTNKLLQKQLIQSSEKSQHNQHLLNELSNQISADLHYHIDAFKAKHSSLQETVSKTEANLQFIQNLYDQFHNLTIKLSQSQSLSSSQSTSSVNYPLRCIQLINQISHLETQIVSIKQNHQQSTISENSKKQEEKQNIEQSNKIIIDGFQKQIHSLHEIIKNGQRQLQKYQEQNRLINSNNDIISSENNELKKVIRELEQSITTLQSQKQSQQQYLIHLESEVTLLTSDNTKMWAQLIFHKEQKENLQALRDEQGKLIHAQNSKLKQQLYHSIACNQSYKSNIKQLNVQLCNKNQQLVQFQNSLIQQKQQHQQQLFKLNSAKSDASSKQQQINLLNNQLIHAKTLLSSASKDISSTHNALTATNQILQQIQQELLNANNINMHLDNELKMSNKKNEFLSENNLFLQNEVKQWKNRLQNAENHIHYQQQYIDQMQKQDYDTLENKFLKNVQEQKRKLIQLQVQAHPQQDYIALQQGQLIITTNDQSNINMSTVNQLNQKIYEVQQYAEKRLKQIVVKINSRGNSLQNSIKANSMYDSVRGSYRMNQAITVETQTNEFAQTEDKQVDGSQEYEIQKLRNESQRKERENKIREYVNENNRLQQQMMNIIFEKDEIQIQKYKLFEQKQQLFECNEKLLEQKQQYAKYKQQMIKEVILLNIQIQKYQSIIKRQHQINTLTVQQLTEQIKQQQNVIDKHRNELDKQSELNRMYIKQIQQLNNRIQQMQQYHEQQKHILQKQIIKINLDVKRKTQTISNISQQKVQLNNKIDHQLAELSVVNRQLLQLTQVSSKIQSGHNSIMQELIKMDIVKQRMQQDFIEEVGELRNQIERLDELRKTKQSKIQQLTNQFNAMNLKYNKIKQVILQMIPANLGSSYSSSTSVLPSDLQLSSSLETLTIILEQHKNNKLRNQQLQSINSTLSAQILKYQNEIIASTQVAKQLEHELAEIYSRIQNSQTETINIQEIEKLRIFNAELLKQLDIKEQIIKDKQNLLHILQKDRKVKVMNPLINKKKKQGELQLIENSFLNFSKSKQKLIYDRKDLTDQERIIMLQRLVFQLEQQVKSFEFSIETFTQQLEIYQQKELQWIESQNALSEALSQINTIAFFIGNDFIDPNYVQSQTEWLKVLRDTVKNKIKQNEKEKKQYEKQISQLTVKIKKSQQQQEKGLDLLKKQQHQAIQQRYEQIITELVQYEAQNSKLSQQSVHLNQRIKQYQKEIKQMKSIDAGNQEMKIQYELAQKQIQQLKQIIDTGVKNQSQQKTKAQREIQIKVDSNKNKIKNFLNSCLLSIQKLQQNVEAIQSQSQLNSQKIQKVIQEFSIQANQNQDQKPSNSILEEETLSNSKILAKQFRDLLHTSSKKNLNQQENQQEIKCDRYQNQKNESQIFIKERGELIMKVKQLKTFISLYHNQAERRKNRLSQIIQLIQIQIRKLREIGAEIVADNGGIIAPNSTTDRLLNSLSTLTQKLNQQYQQFQQPQTLSRIQQHMQYQDEEFQENEKIIYSMDSNMKQLSNNPNSEYYKKTANDIIEVISKNSSEKSFKQLENEISLIRKKYYDENNQFAQEIQQCLIKINSQSSSQFLQTVERLYLIISQCQVNYIRSLQKREQVMGQHKIVMKKLLQKSIENSYEIQMLAKEDPNAYSSSIHHEKTILGRNNKKVEKESKSGSYQSNN